MNMIYFITYFIILFSEKNCKNQTNILFWFGSSLAIKKLLDLDLKKTRTTLLGSD